MIPHTKLARLFIYPGATHPYQAQERNFITLKLQEATISWEKGHFTVFKECKLNSSWVFS